jgi:hypothetical protein
MATEWQSATMTSSKEDPPRDLGPDRPQELLIAAYTRLMQLPRRADGIASTRISTIANWELRLIELPLPGQADGCSLWVELFDLTAGRSVDSRGCQDLSEAGAATQYILALLKQQDTD